MNRWSKFSIIILLGYLFPVAVADMNNQPAKPFWQKEFGYEGLSCFPHLLNVGKNGDIVVIGTMYNQRDFNAVGRIWQWTIDKKTGERLDDMTIKSAKRNDCRAISDFWPTKGLDVIDDNETRLLIEPLERGENQSLIRYKKDRTVEKYEIKTNTPLSGFGIARMKRINQEEYFIYGSETKDGNAVLQKRNNRNNVVWEKQYQYGNWSCISDIAQSHYDIILPKNWAQN
jgi:hypothetical protein